MVYSLYIVNVFERLVIFCLFFVFYAIEEKCTLSC